MSNKELVFSGVQPTGNLHLGNYLGAIKNFVSLQKEMKCVYCVVDLHAITTFQNPEELKNNDMSHATKDIIFQTDIEALKAADLIVALVTGQDIDSGTASEIGFMYANNKPVLAITAEERRYRNLFTEGMFTSSVSNVVELLDEINRLQ